MPEPIFRPTFDTDEAASRDARAAVERLVEELQTGLDGNDADLYNRHFASDVIWGGPFGAIVSGYGDLHAIHVRLHRERRAGKSRYVIERVLTPSPGVALAQVRRLALGDDGQPLDPGHSFSEMALYVLIERDGDWWLVAGQNTPVRPGLSATDR
ncbi:MAG TPA: SgcJ/EcaC family oxidoreductase [Polyangiaceae bacterium]|jgi:uncharacterized protein (TIGR02246 family)|nr:SgcJ/EcaC family oxidoreductase [Polyangiaceae bacterium]